MDKTFSAAELADAVTQWCEQHGIEPANGQAGVRITERNIRFYRSVGLLDAPALGGGQGFTEKHRLQLVAIRLLQAQGLPLNRIRELLFGRTTEDLLRIERQGLAELKAAPVVAFRPAAQEDWRMIPLDEEFLLVSRRGRPISADVRERLLSALNPNPQPRRRLNGARKEH